MYNQSYDEYIRSILGCPNNNQYMQRQSTMDYNFEQINHGNNTRYKVELEACYPEIYKVVYPMVKKACENVPTNLTKENIDKMTDDIYFAIEANNNVQTNAENSRNVKQEDSKTIKQENNRSARPVNRGLRDIIRILILRELLEKPSNNKPQFPQQMPQFSPQMPPFQQGNLGSRPLVMSRFSSEMYEH